MPEQKSPVAETFQTVRIDPAGTLDLPSSCKTRTSSRGAEVLITHKNGSMFSAFPGDYVVWNDNTEPVPLHPPVFHAIFGREVTP